MGASQPAIDMPIRELLFDSRKASGAEGELFLALKTGRRDGHDFAWLAHQRGVRAFVVERQLDLPSDAQQLIVSDLWAALPPEPLEIAVVTPWWPSAAVPAKPGSKNG